MLTNLFRISAQDPINGLDPTDPDPKQKGKSNKHKFQGPYENGILHGFGRGKLNTGHCFEGFFNNGYLGKIYP